MKETPKDTSPEMTGLVSFTSKRYAKIIALFAICITICILYITLLSRTDSLNRRIHAIPFRRWSTWLSGDLSLGREIIENIALFVPFGYLISAFFSASDRKIRAILTLFLGIMLSLGIEVYQYYSGRGIAEADDVLNNTGGAFFGFVIYQFFCAVLGNLKNAKKILYFFFPTLFLIASLCGCVILHDRVSITNLHTDEFWFSIDEIKGDTFSGRCYVYDHATPDYQLFLVNGFEKQKVQLTRSGENFFAKYVQNNHKLEIKVSFNGHPMMSTGVYLNGGKTEYIRDEVLLPAAPKPDAVLKAFSEKYDCYIFQKGNELIWLVSADTPLNTECICHIYTNEPELLPEKRKINGFDNIGFRLSADYEMSGKYRLCVLSLPKTYPITSVTVGLNPGGKVVWCSSFRP